MTISFFHDRIIYLSRTKFFWGFPVLLVLVLFIQIVLALLIYEYKDQCLVKRMGVIFSFYQLNFHRFQAILGSNK